MARSPKGNYRAYVNQLQFFEDGIKITATDTK